MAVNYRGKKFYNIGPRCKCYKTFYSGDLLTFLSDTIILFNKWYYYGNYRGMLVSNTMVIFHGILTLEKIGAAVSYHGIFIPLVKNATVF